jgi:flagellar motor switch protein FliN/FliY
MTEGCRSRLERPDHGIGAKASSAAGPPINSAGDAAWPAQSRNRQPNVTIEIGRAQVDGQQVARLTRNSVIGLQQRADDPVDVLIDGRAVARGELVVLEGKFCVRVVQVLTAPHAA